MDNRSNQGQLTFSKEERITHKGDIEKLFISGKKLNLFPFDIRYYSGNMGSLNKFKQIDDFIKKVLKNISKNG